MRKMIILAAAVAMAAGCSSHGKKGIGVVPLSGATVTGKVVEAGEPSGVLMKTQSDRSFLLPDNWKYQQNGKPVAVKDLTPGATVTAIAPAEEARLVAATDKNLVLESDRGFFSFPAEGLAPVAQQAPVGVQTLGGQYREMPLMQAMEAYPYSVMSHPYYEDYAFRTASPYSVAKGVPVGVYGDSPLMLAPSSQGIGLMQVPQAYPVQSFGNHQPVRFTYRDNNVAVSSWNSLGDSQFNLGTLLLAGTLLDVLPGQAVIEVGQNPLTVPWNYVTYQGVPVGDRRFPVGTPLNVSYYPGAYDLVSYDQSNVTFLYDQYPVQMPVSYLPNYAYNRPVRVRRGQGQWVNMPFQAACRLVDGGGYSMAPSPVAMPYMNHWRQSPVWDPRPIRGRPGYQLVGLDGRGPARVVRDRGRHHRGNDWWAYRPDWNYTLAGLAGPAAWNLSHNYRDRVYRNQQPSWPVARRDDDRRWKNKHNGKSKHHPHRAVAWDRDDGHRWWVDGHRKDRDRQDSDRRWGGDSQRGKDWRNSPVAFGRGDDSRRDGRRGDRERGPLVRKQPPRQEQRREHRVSQRPQQRRENRVSQRPQQRRENRVSQRPQQRRENRVSQRPQQRRENHRVSQRPQQRRENRVSQRPQQRRENRVSQRPQRQQRSHRIANSPRQQRQVSQRSQGQSRQRDSGRRGGRRDR